MSKKENLGDLITNNKENAEKLSAADTKVDSGKDKIEKKISKLILENKQNAKELSAAYKIIALQKKEIIKQAADLVRSEKESEKHRADLIITRKELAHKADLIILNKKLLLANKQEKLAKEKYIELYNFAPTGYLTLNKEGKIIESNHFASQILGKERSFLIGHRFGNFVSDSTKPIFNRFFEQVFTSKTKELCDATLVTDSELPKYVYIGGIVTHNGEQCLITIDDISKRKKAEKDLEKSEMLLKSVFNSSGNLILVVDKDLKVLMSNWKSPIYAGHTDFPIASHCYEAFINQDTPCEPCHVSDVFNTGKPVLKEYYNQYTKLFKEVSAYPIFDDDKNVIMVTEIVQDITERKMAEKALRDSEEKFRSIMENSADAIFITNQHGKYVYTNKAVYALLGYTSEEMKSKTIADISPPDKIKEYYKFFKHILNEGKGFSEIELLKKDGKYISADLNAVILPDGTIYGSCRDITERKLAESELIKAKEKTEESDRLKSAFLANMSHEIRTPMNGILGFTELLKEPNLTSDEQQNYIQTIQISGARMLNTINSIIDISKIESGLTKVNIKETDINEKIEFTYEFFKQVAEIKGLNITVKKGLPSAEAIIKTDIDKVYAILTNLVKNAIKFTYDGSIEFGYEKKGEYLEFFVKDTGVGIPRKQLQMIFERFRQGSESYNRGYEGSGLGLSIAKSYVEMLGGKISVESEEGLGSTFYFTIPYIAASEEKTTIENVVSEEHNEIQLKNLKILIVEDDEISFSLLSRTLQKISKEVLHVVTGVQAVEACRNNPDLDLVLMDIRMPQMNGLEATQQIRQFNEDVIIIAQTAYAFTGDSEKALEAGCNDYISKPINKTLLYELIKKYCNK